MTATATTTITNQTEAYTPREVLVDYSGPVKMTLVEGHEPGQRLVVEGKVGQCDKATLNGRFYTRAVMEREIARLQPRIEQGSLLAAVDHPPDGRTKIKDAGGICRGLRIERDGSVIGRYEIVEDSTNGKDLAAFVRRGAVGMSSRGVGSCRLSPEGYQLVGEDFKLFGYDFVSDPACSDAYPKLVGESVDATTITPAAVAAQFPAQVAALQEQARVHANGILAEAQADIVHQLRKDLQDDFAAKLIRHVGTLREEAKEIVRSELLADPAVAGARRTLDEIVNLIAPYRRPIMTDAANAPVGDASQAAPALAEQAAQIERLTKQVQALEEQRLKLVAKARDFGHALFVEEALRGRSDAKAIRDLIGKPGSYSIEELQSKLQAAMAAATAHQQEAAATAESMVLAERKKAQAAKEQVTEAQDQMAQFRALVEERIAEVSVQFKRTLAERDRDLERAESRIRGLESQLEGARTVSTQARADSLAAFADRLTIGHPERANILAAVHAGRVTSQEQVEGLAESLGYRAEEPGGAPERVRRALGRGREGPSEAERSSITEQSNHNGGGAATKADLHHAGLTLDQMRHLAGVGRKQRRY